MPAQPVLLIVVTCTCVSRCFGGHEFHLAEIPTKGAGRDPQRLTELSRRSLQQAVPPTILRDELSEDERHSDGSPDKWRRRQ
jgi:hypothetical protein